MGASKNEQVDTSASDPRLLLSSFKPMLLNSDILCGDLDMIWNVDYFDDRATEADSPQRSSADSDSNSDRLNDSMEVNTFSDPVLPAWNEETRTLSFESKWFAVIFVFTAAVDVQRRICSRCAVKN